MPNKTYKAYKIVFNKMESPAVIFPPKEDWKRYRALALKSGGYAAVLRQAYDSDEWEVFKEVGTK